VHVTLTNRVDSTITVHGLGSRRVGTLEPVRIPSGATREVRFTADAEGTYYYWGAIGNAPLNRRVFEDGQLAGGMVVDPVGSVPADRIMIISMWAPRGVDGNPDFDREILSINGRPWPYTERLTYALGDSIRWRIINASFDAHSMHLHGFYFRVDASGDLARDTLLWDAGRRMAVTQRMESGTTRTVAWFADRPGGWIFHCHMAGHMIANPTLEPGADRNRVLRMFSGATEESDPDHHATEGMGGLIMGVFIRPPAGYVVNEPKRRELRLFIQSAPAAGGPSGRQFSYILQEGDVPPAPDSMRLPGSTIFLHQGEPTSIRIFNRTDEPSQVHWHGLEIESYFDGVAGMSGYPDQLTPAIAPGDSFEVRITPPRAGSFMYHTHMNDVRQLGSGLYGAFVVLPPAEEWNPARDHVFMYGETPFRDDGMPVVNGTSTPDTLTIGVGETHRLRFMQMTLNRPNTRVRLLADGFPVRWMPIAKDGFDLSAAQRTLEEADQFVAVGETYDYAFTPNRVGILQLEYRTGGGVLLISQPVKVVNRNR
jgi:FtsP/CotA-like multicopper oxidase with cupredoxin domain